MIKINYRLYQTIVKEFNDTFEETHPVEYLHIIRYVKYKQQTNPRYNIDDLIKFIGQGFDVDKGYVYTIPLF